MGEVKGQISLNFDYHVHFKDFLYKTLCVFSQMKDTEHIRQEFHSVTWVMPQGWDFGANEVKYHNFWLSCPFQRFLYQNLCVFLQIKDRKHIEHNFYFVAGVMTWGCWRVKNLSVGICDGAPSTVHSNKLFEWVALQQYAKQ